MADGHVPVGTELSLAERIASGDRSAEDELVEAFREPVFCMALSRTRNREAARDLAQEAMLSVLQAVRAGKLRQPESLAGFVHATARNLIGCHLRGRRTTSAEAARLPDPLVESPEETFESSERAALVRHGLSRLRPKDRLILLLTLVDGMKVGEIAERLGLPVEVVRQRKSRAVKRIAADVKRSSRMGKRPHQVGRVRR